MAEAFPDTTIVAKGPYYFPEKSGAEVVAGELKKLGVNPERIVNQDDAHTTFAELKNVVKIIHEKGWSSGVVVSNEYHIPRVKEMYVRLREFAGDDADVIAALNYIEKNGIKVDFLGAEPILKIRSPKYERFLKKVENSDGFKRRIVVEQKGVEDIRAGRYKLR
mgnify:CR=1 FL=1